MLKCRGVLFICAFPALGLMLAGCGGGDDGGGAPAPGLSVVGVWEGAFLGGDGAETAFAVLHPGDGNGNRFMMADDTNILYVGDYVPLGSSGFLASTVRRVNADGQNLGDLNVNGSVDRDNQAGAILRIEMSTPGAAAAPQNLQLLRSASYEQPSGLDRVAATWVDSGGLFTSLQLTIGDSSGNNIAGQNGNCFFSGVISTPNQQRNLYMVNLFITGGSQCEVGGQYTGFASTQQDDRVMRLMLANQGRGLTYTLVKP